MRVLFFWIFFLSVSFVAACSVDADCAVDAYCAADGTCTAVTCEETDSGSDYSNAGTTTGTVNRASNGRPLTYTDSCLDEMTLEEFSCDPETQLVVSDEVSCEEVSGAGAVCQDGRCLETQCSDGIDNDGDSGVDYLGACSPSTRLSSSSSSCLALGATSRSSCEAKCTEGAYIDADPECFSSDWVDERGLPAPDKDTEEFLFSAFLGSLSAREHTNFYQTKKLAPSQEKGFLEWFFSAY